MPGKFKSTLTADRAREVLAYDRDSGELTWRVTLSNRSKAGSLVRRKGNNGYYRVAIDGATYVAHRVAWLMETGSWPDHEIDHRNGVRTDNSWGNLRGATRSENAQNLGPNRRNTSGYRGVVWAKANQRWTAQIRAEGRVKRLGYFDTAEAASVAYAAAKRRYHTFSPEVRTA